MDPNFSKSNQEPRRHFDTIAYLKNEKLNLNDNTNQTLSNIQKSTENSTKFHLFFEPNPLSKNNNNIHKSLKRIPSSLKHHNSKYGL